MKVQTQTMEMFVKSQALNNLNEFRTEKNVSAKEKIMTTRRTFESSWPGTYKPRA